MSRWRSTPLPPCSRGLALTALWWSSTSLAEDEDVGAVGAVEEGNGARVVPLKEVAGIAADDDDLGAGAGWLGH
jgi:hypothetical protein